MDLLSGKLNTDFGIIYRYKKQWQFQKSISISKNCQLRISCCCKLKSRRVCLLLSLIIKLIFEIAIAIEIDF